MQSSILHWQFSDPFNFIHRDKLSYYFLDFQIRADVNSATKKS